jgi:transcriptional regulator with XRE-family HTH domain
MAFDRRIQAVLDNISGNVTRLRVRQGLTQEQLAEAAEIDLTSLQRVEWAKMNASIGVLVRIADALDVHPRVFLRKATRPATRRGRPARRRVARRAAPKTALPR